MKRSIEVKPEETYAEANKTAALDPTAKMSNPEKWQYLFEK